MLPLHLLTFLLRGFKCFFQICKAVSQLVLFYTCMLDGGYRACWDDLHPAEGLGHQRIASWSCCHLLFLCICPTCLLVSNLSPLDHCSHYRPYFAFKNLPFSLSFCLSFLLKTKKNRVVPQNLCSNRKALYYSYNFSLCFYRRLLIGKSLAFQTYFSCCS